MPNERSLAFSRQLQRRARAFEDRVPKSAEDLLVPAILRREVRLKMLDESRENQPISLDIDFQSVLCPFFTPSLEQFGRHVGQAA
jgi:hypothetical protein